MAYLAWRSELNTGIEAIDNQHRRIVELINQLHAAQSQGEAVVGEVIEGLVDYTVSHFAFEEALMESAGYPFSRAHKRIHDLFIRRVSDYRTRYERGEDITEEVKGLLSRWLLSHILNEDENYVAAVKNSMLALTDDRSAGGWLARSMKRFFGQGSTV